MQVQYLVHLRAALMISRQVHLKGCRFLRE